MKTYQSQSSREYIYESKLADISRENPPHYTLIEWIEEATKKNITDPNAFALSTTHINKNNNTVIPNSRIVLAKSIQENKIVFYTSYESQKGIEIEQNDHVACLFFYPDLNKQIRLKGICSKVSKTQSDQYFKKRNRKSQIVSILSKQSKKLKSLEFIDFSYQESEKKYQNQTEIKRPSHWGGYKIDLYEYEFWIGHLARLNTRVVFTKNKNKQWECSYLWP